ncbi:MAG: N-acetylneuraminate synthase family protein [Promethearchaeota archaeon]
MEPYIVINGRKIGNDYPVYFIGEIGINHNGSIQIAQNLIDYCAKYGADCVKFQKRDFGDLYLNRIIENPSVFDQQIQYSLFAQKRADLSESELKYLKEYAESKNMDFLCTAFDKASVDFLEKLNVSAYKVASADLTNLPLLDYICKMKKPIIISTGMSTYSEIEQTVEFLKSRDTSFCLLHCNSTYPALNEEINLKFITTLKKFRVPVGYSGHERGLAISVASTLFGACIVERHITLDRTMKGPDHSASLEPEGLRRVIRDIKHVKQAIGADKRYISRGEYFNREILGKSIVSTRSIKKGEIFKEDMLTTKSPAKGISPQFYFDLLGRTAIRDIEAEEYLKFLDLGQKFKEIKLTASYNWGLIVRFSDYKNYLDYKPNFFEFHLTDQDVFVDLGEWFSEPINAGLVIHAPTNWEDDVMDISSENRLIQKRSIDSLINTVDLTRRMSKYFLKQKDKPVKLVLHIPGFSQFERIIGNGHLYHKLHDVLTSIDFDGIELLIENLPPNGWYYGGHSYLNLFCNPREIRAFLEKEKLKMTFDTSHAGMYVNSLEGEHMTVAQFYQEIKHLIRHVHIADAIGIMGEGIQVGDGMINFKAFLPELIKTNVSYTPEIWLGHNYNGRGFLEALNRISEIIRDE